MEILVQEHDILRRRPGQQELDRRVEEGRLERQPGLLPGRRKAVCPMCRLVRERPELAGRSRLPELGEDARRNDVRLVLLHLPQSRPRKTALDEQSPAPVVASEQTHGAGPVPASEGVGLLLALRLREIDLEHRRRAVLAARRHDESDVRRLEGRLELERPLLHELGHEPWQALEPFRTARLAPPPVEARRNGEGRAVYSPTAARKACSASWPKTAKTTRSRFAGSKARASVTISSAH